MILHVLLCLQRRHDEQQCADYWQQQQQLSHTAFLLPHHPSAADQLCPADPGQSGCPGPGPVQQRDTDIHKRDDQHCQQFSGDSGPVGGHSAGPRATTAAATGYTAPAAAEVILCGPAAHPAGSDPSPHHLCSRCHCHHHLLHRVRPCHFIALNRLSPGLHRAMLHYYLISINF